MGLWSVGRWVDGQSGFNITLNRKPAPQNDVVASYPEEVHDCVKFLRKSEVPGAS